MSNILELFDDISLNSQNQPDDYALAKASEEYLPEHAALQRDHDHIQYAERRSGA